MADYVWVAEIDETQVIKALESIEKRIEQLTKVVENNFNRMEKSSVAAIKQMADLADRAFTDMSNSVNNSSAGVDRTISTYEKLEKQLVNLIAQKLKLAVGSEQTVRKFIDLTAAVSTTSEAFLLAVSQTDKLSKDQISLAEKLSRTEQTIQVFAKGLSQEGTNAAELTAEIKRLQGGLEALNDAQAQSTTEAQEMAEALNIERDAIASVAKQAQQLDTQLKNLLASELQSAAGADDNAKSFLRQAEAGAKSSNALSMAARQSGSLSEEQVALAERIAVVKQAITLLTDELSKEGANVDQVKAKIKDYAKELSNMETIQRRNVNASAEAAKAQAAAEKEFRRLVATFPEINNSLGKLTREYGAFSVRVGQAGTAQGQAQNRFLQVISTNQRLQAELQKLTEKYGSFTVAVDRATFAKKKLGDEFETMAKRAGFLGAIIGSLSGIILSRFITRLQMLGSQASQVFQNMIKESVATAESFEATGIAFRAIFEGSQEAADATFKFVRQLSKEFGVDVSSLAASFLPRVQNLEQLRQLSRLSAEILRLPAAVAQNKTQTDAIIALSEIMAGQPRSLQTRFNIPIEDTRRIKELQAELGLVDGLIVGLSEVTARLGVSFGDFANTTPILLGRVKESLRDLRDEAGKPIMEAFSKVLQETLKFMKENEEEINTVANAFGKLIATLAELTFEEIKEFLQNTDFSKLSEDIGALAQTARSIKDVTDLLGILFRVLKLLTPTGLGEAIAALLGIERRAITLGGVLTQLTQVIGILTAAFAGVIGGVAAFNDSMTKLIEGFVYHGESLNQFGKVLEFTKKGYIAGASAGLEWVETLKHAERVISSFGKSAKEAKEGIEKPIDNLDIADFIRGMTFAKEEIAKLRAEIDELQDTVIKPKMQEFDDDIQKRRMEIERDHLRRQFDMELDFSRKREDNARKTFDKISQIARIFQETDVSSLSRSDIDTENKRRIALLRDFISSIENAEEGLVDKLDDIRLAFRRSEEDAYKKDIRRQEDLEEQNAKKRIDLEKEYQRKIADIRRRFEFDAQEAIRENDAIKFLQLKRRTEFELENARRNRDEANKDLDEDADRKRQDLKKQLDRELEDARIAHRRKLEDLKIALNREIDAILEAERIQRREEEISEKHRREDFQRAYERRLEDYSAYIEERLSKLLQDLDAEFTTIKDHQKTIMDLEALYYKNSLGMMRKYSAERAKLLNSAGINAPSGMSDPATMIPRHRLVDEARRLVRAADPNNVELLRAILNMTKSQLIETIERFGGDLSKLFNTGGAIPREKGGKIYPGSTYLVGEKGPELLRTDFPGRIDPIRNSMSFPAMSSRPTSIDNRRIQQVDLSMLDPNYFSPIQLAIIENTVKQILLGAIS
jgi:hypothetical protein